MPSPIKLLIFGACTIAVGFAEALAKDAIQGSSKSASYSPSRVQSQSSPVLGKIKQSDLSASASSPLIQSNGHGQYPGPFNTQPSIYHSIIDRSASTNQPASPVQTTASASGDLNTAAGHHHGHAHGKYYEYREVPKKKTWKFGYKRGNHKHTISRHEHGKAGKHPHFKTKVKWHDKKSKGKGIHLWDYNHHDKKHYHHG